MRRKFFPLGVFEDQESLFTKQISLKYQVDDLLGTLQIVGGIREDDVELLGAGAQVEEGVGFDGKEVFDAE